MRISVVSIIGLLAAASARTAAADVYCSPDRPVVFTGEQVTLTAWSASTEPVEYSWSSSKGQLSAAKNTATWKFNDVAPGRYQAMVVAKSPSGAQSCSLVIFYQSEPIYRGTGNAEAARGLLAAGAKEPGGYGVYSYILMGEPADDRNTERYRKALDAYVALAVPLEQMERYFDRGQLNVVQVPVTRKPANNPKPTSETLLASYDFARAGLLLNHAGVSSKTGPYLVSSLAPLTGAPSSGIFLVQDLSGVPPSIIDLWVREFLNQAAQKRSWKSDDLRRFLLNVRTVIEVAAGGYPQVKASVGEYIRLVSK